MTTLQSLYNRVISSKIPLAVPSQLSHIEQLGAGHGKVLIYSKKPRRFHPHRREDLKLTDCSLSSLLDESSLSQLKITAATSREFETSKDDPVKVTVNLKTTPDIKKSLVDLGIDASESKEATISADFGKVTNMQTSPLYSCSNMKICVKMDDPTVQEAIATGGTLFVTTTVYEGERCHLSVSVGDSQKQVFSHDKPTVLAYLLLKLSIDRHGQLHPQRNNGFLCVVECRAQALQVSTNADPSCAIRKEINRFRSREAMEHKGWVIVDVLGPGEVAEDEDQEDNLATASEDSTVPSVPSQPIESESRTTSAPPPDSESAQFPHQSSTFEGSKVTEKGIPVVEEAMVQEIATLASEPSPTVKGLMATEERVPIVETATAQVVTDLMSEPIVVPDSPHLDEHYVYSLKDFQPFESITYNGIYGEVQEWVKPLVTNKTLHSAYLSYVTPPHTTEKLKKLSQFLQEYGKALRAHKPTPAVTYAPMEPVISVLDSEWSVKLDEVSSMIVVSEALVEFPQHIVKKAIELSSEKRTTLVDFIRHTPYGVDKHVYTDEGPFMDPELNPFMTRMGFSIPSHTNKLALDLSHEENEDRLAAGLILIVSTKQQ